MAAIFLGLELYLAWTYRAAFVRCSRRGSASVSGGPPIRALVTLRLSVGPASCNHTPDSQAPLESGDGYGAPFRSGMPERAWLLVGRALRSGMRLLPP